MEKNSWLKKINSNESLLYASTSPARAGGRSRGRRRGRKRRRRVRRRRRRSRRRRIKLNIGMINISKSFRNLFKTVVDAEAIPEDHQKHNMTTRTYRGFAYRTPPPTRASRRSTRIQTDTYPRGSSTKRRIYRQTCLVRSMRASLLATEQPRALL